MEGVGGEEAEDHDVAGDEVVVCGEGVSHYQSPDAGSLRVWIGPWRGGRARRGRRRRAR